MECDKIRANPRDSFPLWCINWASPESIADWRLEDIKVSWTLPALSQMGEARMKAQPASFHHDYSETIVCPRCGACGAIHWDMISTPSGPKKEFSGITGDFYERLHKKAPYPIEIVCTVCRIAVPNSDTR